MAEYIEAFAGDTADGATTFADDLVNVVSTLSPAASAAGDLLLAGDVRPLISSQPRHMSARDEETAALEAYRDALYSTRQRTTIARSDRRLIIRVRSRGQSVHFAPHASSFCDETSGSPTTY